MEEFPELSLGLGAAANNDGGGAGSDREMIRLPMKRKIRQFFGGGGGAGSSSSSVDLHQPAWKEPLPLDWEQCLDLQSGRMYYVNRKTMRKTWEWPQKQQQKLLRPPLDLDLNISTGTRHFRTKQNHSSPTPPGNTAANGGGDSMIALPCSNCHLLVIVSQASPSCPNCKFLQYSIAAGNQSPAAKPLHSGGLSLFL
ncbi:unnamed protein product [Cuscuta epithymum]|uniref:WW domain-containing protein n=1 Tax=Cuscuta epithymum TaxID=186058 RepID=A0AAV0F7I4_9ASTE|nr:unnamed protein product [Cuscuta epithymum]